MRWERSCCLLLTALLAARLALGEEAVCLAADGDACENAVEEDCGASKFLSPTHTVPGFHLVCLKPQKDGESFTATVFRDGTNKTLSFDMPGWDWKMLRADLEEKLSLNTPGNHPNTKYPWTIYTANGSQEVTDSSQAEALVANNEALFVFKGGSFIWPGVQVGHKQVVKGLQGIGSIEMVTASMRPLVYEMRNFLSKEECSHIQERASPFMAPSPVSLMDHDRGKKDSEWRTSTTYFMSSNNDEMMQDVDQRVEDLTRQPIPNQEDCQVLRYEVDQRYDAHHDFFDPKLYRTSDGILKMTDQGRRNRMITVFWYLSDVAEGGETNFPRSGSFAGSVDFKSCSRGLKVKPEEGKVAMFYSMLPDGQLDDFSLHGACPVKNGTKWAANKWVWNRPFSHD